MSENLIYGADISSYGAVADGKTDCSDAFIKAIENGENLIVVPYGKYVIKKSLKLSSNLKIELHANAQILFDTKENVCVSADNCSSVIITGGSFICEEYGKTLLEFTNSSGVKVTNCKISASNGICLKDCENVTVKNVLFDIDGDCIRLRGENEDMYLRDILAFSCISVIDIHENAEIENIFADNITITDCKHLLVVYEGKIKEAKFCGIFGDFSESLVFVSETSCLCDVDVCNIETYCNSNKATAYFDLKGNLDGVEVCDFSRKEDHEARPFAPTLIFKPTKDSTAIIDGMMLDHVINARALSKTVSMTTARLTNPTNKFIYTLECTIIKNDALTIPFGDFNSMAIYTK